MGVADNGINTVNMVNVKHHTLHTPWGQNLSVIALNVWTIPGFNQLISTNEQPC